MEAVMLWFTRVMLVICCVTLILLAAALVVGRTLSAGSEVIAFQSGRMIAMDIHLYDVRTGVTHNLTRQPGPDRLADKDRNDAVMPVYAREYLDLPPQADDVSPVWSPDGRRLAFVSYRDGNSEIYLLDLRSGQLRNLTNHPGSDTSPAWSPDGTQLAYVSTRNEHQVISVIDVETGTIRDLTDHTRTSASPTWSPDSRRIVFQSKRGRYWDLYMIDLETGETRSLTNSTSDDLNPVWAVVSP
jgi:dipeptidyl aminopeptidase/acylaminoacyl peptidase